MKTDSIDVYEIMSEDLKNFKKQALEGPDCTYDEAVKAMRPKNQGKKLSEYYPGLKNYGL